MKIELLYIAGCPTHHAAAELIDDVLAELGLDAPVEHIDVATADLAQDLCFIGSPTIRVDGVDIDPSATERAEFGRSCRVYPTAEGHSGIPPRGLLVEALRTANDA
jgi:hypothetical protein